MKEKVTKNGFQEPKWLKIVFRFMASPFFIILCVIAFIRKLLVETYIFISQGGEMVLYAKKHQVFISDIMNVLKTKKDGIVYKEPRYRVGKKQGRAILEIETGREYIVFPQGKEQAAADYCEYLNKYC